MPIPETFPISRKSYASSSFSTSLVCLPVRISKGLWVENPKPGLPAASWLVPAPWARAPLSRSAPCQPNSVQLSLSDSSRGVLQATGCGRQKRPRLGDPRAESSTPAEQTHLRSARRPPRRRAGSGARPWAPPRSPILGVSRPDPSPPDPKPSQLPSSPPLGQLN